MDNFYSPTASEYALHVQALVSIAAQRDAKTGKHVAETARNGKDGWKDAISTKEPPLKTRWEPIYGRFDSDHEPIIMAERHGILAIMTSDGVVWNQKEEDDGHYYADDNSGERMRQLFPKIVD